MKRRIFSKTEQEELLRNPNIEKCSDKSITYSTEFKISAVKKYKNGISPIHIFKQAKIDINIIGNKNPKKALSRWKNKSEIELFTETTGKNRSERPQIKNLTLEEKLLKLEAKVKYLEIENELLKKLDSLERSWLAKKKK